MHLLTRTSAPAEVKSERTFDEVISLLDSGDGSRATSGIVVTSRTALQQATVWACVRILAEIIAQLPLYMQARRGGRWVDIDDHPSLSLLARPNEWQTPHEFISHLVTWSELRGNGYCYKARDGAGRVGRMLPLRADSVTCQQRSDWSLLYSVSNENGLSGIFSAEDILHLRNFGNDGYMGLSTISNLRNSIALAHRAEEHGARLFSNGAQLGKHFILPTAKADQVREFRDELRKYQGSQNAHLPFVAGGEVKVENVGMSNDDAQFLQTRKMQVQQIAGAFGVPLFLLNDTEKSTSWGTGLEQTFRAFLTASLGPRIRRLTQTLDRELLLANERRRLRHVIDTDGLTMGDFKDRMAGYRTGIESGVLNPNECRELEGRNPRDGGDEYRQPANIVIEGDEAEPEPDPEPVIEEEEAA